MTVGELKKALEGVEDDKAVEVCVEKPNGFTCPDGATVGVDRVVEGIDWHMSDLLIVPRYRLCLRDDSEVEKWSKRQ